MLSCAHINVQRGGTTIIHDISLQLPAGKLIALLGPNGAGKTTLITTLAGLTTPTSGTITLHTTPITTWPTHERVAHGIVYLPQHAALFTSMSIWDNLRIIFDYHPAWQHRSYDDFCHEATTRLEHVGLAAMSDRLTGVLSGGQKRKVEVARALLMQPRILLCDEPFAGVDPKSTSELTALFTTLAHEHNVCVLLSDHNVAQLLAHADYGYLVLAGTIAARGTSDELTAHAVMQEQYLGEGF